VRELQAQGECGQQAGGSAAQDGDILYHFEGN
jgi:hypothetical protein